MKTSPLCLCFEVFRCFYLTVPFLHLILLVEIKGGVFIPSLFWFLDDEMLIASIMEGKSDIATSTATE
jgi:hypothetical protein